MIIICSIGCFCSSLAYKWQVALSLYFSGCKSRSKGSSLKPHISGDLIHDWYVRMFKFTLTDGCFSGKVLRGHSFEVVLLVSMYFLSYCVFAFTMFCHLSLGTKYRFLQLMAANELTLFLWRNCISIFNLVNGFLSYFNRWFGIQLNPQFMGIDLKYVMYPS